MLVIIIYSIFKILSPDINHPKKELKKKHLHLVANKNFKSGEVLILPINVELISINCNILLIIMQQKQ